MAQVVEPDVGETRTRPDGLSGVIEFGHVRSRTLTVYDPWIALYAREFCEEPYRLWRERDHPRARLCVGEHQFALLKRHVLPS